MTTTHPNYWLDRYTTAIESATNAPGERSRSAYHDLARHYWSMHQMVAGRNGSAPVPLPVCPNDALTARWAA